MKKLLFLFILLAGCARPDALVESFNPNDGEYEVQVYYKGEMKPWALAPRYTLSFPIKIRAPKSPGIDEISKRIRVPFDGYQVCRECPYLVRQIKAPVEQPIEDKL